ncbi:secreted and surface protein containing fasciclin-like repeats [Nonlabens marinus S1-08]|uniref:Secreted and surface protein containing fasciclin-like repeats n=2 Tax=Nonlabens TaxID=363408 RepID=W8VUN6_9FLAO|nr:fasciclin domain-containing protein [Nonlabens marinus]BAO54738.1 secreted and surface protein containing fasciclin-like repeats [Nonlabens marinus S1-08]
MFLLVGSQVSAQVETIGKPVMVGGEEMNPAKNIIENASKSKAHKTLVAAIKAAGLVETLSGAGPFTVFAPTNTAFSALPDGTLETLLKPENKEQLIQLLTFHVIPGKINSTDLIALMDKNNGRASIATIEGGKLTFYMEDGDVYLKDEKGKNAAVTIADVNQSNGVIHVIDAVLTPKK